MTYHNSMVLEFHKTFKMGIKDAPAFPKKDRQQLRINLIHEEFKELKKAISDGNIIEVADALGDLRYVIEGTAIEFGIPLEEVFEEIHRSNMTKVLPDGSIQVREDGKILKPKTYVAPDIAAILCKYAV